MKKGKSQSVGPIYYDGMVKTYEYDSSIYDSSASKHPISGVGTAGTTTTQFKFGACSLSLNGSTDYLTSPDSDDWNFGSGDFTIDMQVKLNVTNVFQIALSQKADTNNYWFFQLNNDGSVSFHSQSVGSYVCDYTTVPQTWGSTFHHVAIVRRGSVGYIFFDGTDITPASPSTSFGTHAMPDLAAPLNIGVGGPYYINGYIDELRVSKGVARWTAPFIAPLSKYNIDNYTKLLLHFDELYAQPQTSVTISGLNGDVDEEYELRCRFVCGANSDYFGATFNNDGASNHYGFQRLMGSSSSASAAGSANSYIALDHIDTVSIGQLSMVDMKIYAKSGFQRTMMNTDSFVIAGTSITDIIQVGQTWINTTDNITSMQVYAGQTNGLGVGTSIQLYARKSKI